MEWHLLKVNAHTAVKWSERNGGLQQLTNKQDSKA